MATCWLTSEAKNPRERKKFKCPGGLNSINKSGNISPRTKLGGVLGEKDYRRSMVKKQVTALQLLSLLSCLEHLLQLQKATERRGGSVIRTGNWESNLPRVTGQGPASATKPTAMTMTSSTGVKEPARPRPARGAWRRDKTLTRVRGIPSVPGTAHAALGTEALPSAAENCPQPSKDRGEAPGGPWRHSHLRSP